MTLTRSLAAGAVALCVSLFLVASASASIPAADGTVNGCYKTSHPNEGALFVIDSVASCPSGYTSLNWARGIPGAWQTPSLGAGCVSIDLDSDTITETVKYRLEGNVVRIKGVANSCSSSSPVVFTLPTGYRPAETRIANGAMVVEPSGDVTFPGFGAGGTLLMDGSFPIS